MGHDQNSVPEEAYADIYDWGQQVGIPPVLVARSSLDFDCSGRYTNISESWRRPWKEIWTYGA